MRRAILLMAILPACLPTSSAPIKTAGFGGGSTGGATSPAGVTAHSALTGLTTGDDHTQYQKESEKSSANGYASLNSSGYVPGAELGSGSSITTKYLRGDNTWQTISGSGDVVGPASSTDNAVCRFDLATGKLIQNSGVLIDDSNNMSAVANLSNTGTTTFGDASGDTVTSNAATWTFASDTAVALTGGVNGINFDSNTLSIDATNNRVGIGTSTPRDFLDIASSDLYVGSFITSSNVAGVAYSEVTNNFGDYFAVSVYGTSFGGTYGGGLAPSGISKSDVAEIATNTSTFIWRHTANSPWVLATNDTERFRVTGGGDFIFNEWGNSVDFRLEGDTDSSLFIADGSADSVGIGDSTPDAKLDVAGTFQCDGNAVIGDAVASDTLTINALMKLASKTWAGTDCDAAGEVGRIVMHDTGANVISACVCQQTGASTYAFAAMGGGTCP
jgi:hypothetical protein